MEEVKDERASVSKAWDQILAYRSDLLERRGQFDALLVETETKFDELGVKINGLLPGATSAGLASAYSDLRKDAASKQFYYSLGFYVGIAILLFAALSVVTDSLTWADGWKAISLVSPFEYLNNLVFKLSVVIPILWLTITLSKRRSEMHRLV